MPDEITTLRISKDTKDKFDKLGNVSMTADDVLLMLIDFYNSKNKN